MKIIEKKYTPSNEELEILKQVHSSGFPYFLSMDNLYSPTEPSRAVFLHTLMLKNILRLPDYGVINSPYYEQYESIFKNFCKQNDIEVNTIFRACINLSTGSNIKHGFKHKDHYFEHKNFIMYLNDASGDTYIYDDDDNLITSIKPELYKAVVFDGLTHAAGFCKENEYRIVLVFTFI
jgi:hypothetical protein